MLATIALACVCAQAGDLARLDGQWPFPPGATSVSCETTLPAPRAPAGQLTFRARLTVQTIQPVELFAYVVTSDHLWYQTSPPVRLSGTRSVNFAVDLGPESGEWVPVGHLRPWDERASRRVRTIGLKAFGIKPLKGAVVIEGARLAKESQRPRARLRILDFSAPERARVGRLCEISFRLPPLTTANPQDSARPLDPFDPDEINVQGLFVLPGGGNEYRLVPGFYYQGYADRWEGASGRLVPVGPGEWRIRYWPERPGPHRCTVVVHTPRGEAREAPNTKRSQRAPLDLRQRWPDLVVGRDYNGRDTVYIHRPGGWRPDGRVPPPGTLNAWRPPIEWTERWGGYGGLGRYNLAVAAQFDRLLDEAARRGMSLPLALTCDEPFGERAKFNWKDNPLNKANGGPLEAPSRFFTNPAAWPHFQQRVRYVLARWGGHPAVSSWELWASMPTNGAEAWHARAGEYLATWPPSTPSVSKRWKAARNGSATRRSSTRSRPSRRRPNEPPRARNHSRSSPPIQARPPSCGGSRPTGTPTTAWPSTSSSPRGRRTTCE